VARGDDFLASRDIGSARLFYERAATAGDGRAALRLGVTFDPGFLGPAGITGIPGDPERAAAWYRRARDLGETAAVDRLKSLEEHPPAAPDATHAARVSGAAPGRLNPSAAKR
jgi:TPR repeat protein